MQTFIQFGAGAAGRAVMGAIFSRAGFEVVFVDIDEPLIERLNARGSYSIVERFSGRPEHIVTIDNVRAVSARDGDRVAAELAGAALAGTSVGMRALQHVVPVLAHGMAGRNGRGLDVILGENMKHGALACTNNLKQAGLTERAKGVSWVEACIGRMIAPVANDELDHVVTEPHLSLIVSEPALRTAVMPVDGLVRTDDISAIIDRKLFIHNMAHATLAYAARRDAPRLTYVHEAVTHAAVREATIRCMRESAQALVLAYPAVFGRSDLDAYIGDLLERFANEALADTLVRVGRDVSRKLSRDDRLIGAMRLAVAQGVECPALGASVVAAMRFVRDAEGEDECDRAFAHDLANIGVERILDEHCKLDEANEVDAGVRSAVLHCW
jgi:mannitol-1-phosphate 5-dehydrogenase